jgi:F-type H+-transporting ATPase subunit b
MSRRLPLLLSALLAALALLLAGAAQAQPHGSTAPAHGAAAPEHGATPAGAEHGATPAEGGEHGATHDEPGEINWFYGMLVEGKEGAEPTLLVRPKGMQPPLAAMLLNTAILFYLIIRFGRRPLSDALKKRKTSIMQGIQDASRMKDEAQRRLAEYEEKLAHTDQEIERVRREMRAAGEAERARILVEAKERRARMERDAQQLIEQEIKAARQEITREMVASAVKSAAERMAKELGSADHQRLADEYLATLDKAFVAKGGQA